MKYLSLEQIVKARTYVAKTIKKPDTFMGLILFLLCVVEKNRNGFYLKSDMQNFSRLADDAFYLSDKKNEYNDKFWYALLANDWIEQVRDYFLKGDKVSEKMVLYSLFWSNNYSDIVSIKNQISREIYQAFFTEDLIESDFNEEIPVSCELLLDKYHGDENALTIKFDNSFVVKKAGDLNGAPFGQTLYAATEIKKIISVFDFDFIKKFDLTDYKIFNNNFISSSTIILPKPFLLLAGISGTGKTRFVREQAKATGQLDQTYCLTSVRPDWHEPSDLLGYISRLGPQTEYVTTDVLLFIAKAWRAIADSGLNIQTENDQYGHRLVVTGDQDTLKQVLPYWLCLDEMNLAPVEQYFADYLSILETREWQWNADQFSYSCDALLKPATINAVADTNKLRDDLGFKAPEHHDLWQQIMQFGLPIPFNLMVAGTVNMDETTHGFSRKVIDRALSIDFGEFFPNDYTAFFNPTSQNKQLTYPIYSHANQQNLTATYDSDGSKSLAFLAAVNGVLKNTPFELAFRALNELLLSVVCTQPQDDMSLKAVWDDFLMCKVLPRIEGDSDKLSTANGQNILEELIVLLAVQLNPIWNESDANTSRMRPDLYREKITTDVANESDKVIEINCRSKHKLAWMQQRLNTATFTSFWP